MGNKYNMFLTGATGLLGRHILYELLSHYIDNNFEGHIYVLIRSKAIDSQARLDLLFQYENIPNYLKKYDLSKVRSVIKIIDSDLNDKDFESKVQRDIPTNVKLGVIHSAAITSFFTDKRTEKLIYENNYIGTKNLLNAFIYYEIKLTYISTVYARGMVEGIVQDAFIGVDISDRLFRNPYEKYKAMSEQDIKEHCDKSGIKYQILRPSTICGRLIDEPNYFTSKFDVFYGWTKFFFFLKGKGIHEEVRICVRKDNDLNIIPVDYVAKATVRAFQTDVKELNIVHWESIRFDILFPMLLESVNYENYKLVEDSLSDKNRTEVFYYRTVGKAFSKYLNCPKIKYDTKILLEIMRDIQQPSIGEQIQRLVKFAKDRRFIDLDS